MQCPEPALIETRRVHRCRTGLCAVNGRPQSLRSPCSAGAVRSIPFIARPNRQHFELNQPAWQGRRRGAAGCWAPQGRLFSLRHKRRQAPVSPLHRSAARCRARQLQRPPSSAVFLPERRACLEVIHMMNSARGSALAAVRAGHADEDDGCLPAPAGPTCGGSRVRRVRRQRRRARQQWLRASRSSWQGHRLHPLPWATVVLSLGQGMIGTPARIKHLEGFSRERWPPAPARQPRAA